MAKFDDSKFFDAKRLKDLGDGIFAFSMTFLIVTIDIPKVPINMFDMEFSRMVPDILTYVLSFFLLAIYWMTNHIQMKEIKRADSRLVWINILLFLTIVFVPLTTDLYAFYDGSILAMLLFNINTLLIGSVFLLQWHHLAANDMHHEDFKDEEIKDRYIFCATLMLTALAAIGIGLISPVWSPVAYLFLTVYRVGLRRKMIKNGPTRI